MLGIGVDPGIKGGAALVELDSSGGIKVLDMHTFKTEEGFIDWVRGVSLTHKIEFAYLEKVHAMPQQGVSSTFTFGCNYGFERGVMKSLLSCKVTLVTPQAWQSPLNLPKGVTKTQHKNDLKRVAIKLWPSWKITHALADGALIARYGALKTGGIKDPFITANSGVSFKSVASRILSSACKTCGRKAPCKNCARN